MSKDKNELNEASNNLSNEKKLDATDESKPKKLESEIKNDKKDTLSPESKKSASNSNNKDPKPRDGEKKIKSV